MILDIATLAGNVKAVREKVKKAALKAGTNPNAVHLIAVSKTVGLEEVDMACRQGLSDFGENRVQDLMVKQSQYPRVRWHMIGRLQTNKVKDVIGRAFLIHSLDRWSLAEYIERRAEKERTVVSTLLQVNVSGEKSKGGVAPGEVQDFLYAVSRLNHLRVQGLMTMAPEVDDPEETRPVFKELRRIFDIVKESKYPRVEMRYLSMGMTQDFEVAIEEGANMVRIGRALFDPGFKEV
ncbi:MAG: YggS family pyridoxal phosphate-dependent enzyme [Syntrophomonadaceae bacterium]|jgi:pyridoxal phosphate enzyme (YggS family)|nr:YggS family pyridoxal phosphate-dependent enzyme [Syntrophomonadaceae bacterium]